MKVVLAADHAGLPLRARLADAVEAAGHEAVLMGPDSGDPVDYPDVAEIVCARDWHTTSMALYRWFVITDDGSL